MPESELATWLEDVQKTMGITYTEDDAEERLRALFQQLCPEDVRNGPPAIGYYGFTEQPLENGSRKRTTIKKLVASIVLPDGSRYTLELTGPFGLSGN